MARFSPKNKKDNSDDYDDYRKSLKKRQDKLQKLQSPKDFKIGKDDNHLHGGVLKQKPNKKKDSKT
jgi:hypothetical protein